MDAGFCAEALAADVALGLGVLPAAQAAAAIARYLETREARLLADLGEADRARVEAEVRRLVEEAGGDVRAALARRGVDRELPASLAPEASLALSDAGARFRAPLRAVDPRRYVGFLPLGEGGMGVVYLALDSELNRRVAFKMIRPGPGQARAQTATDPMSADSRDLPEDAVARFLQEAVVTGGLEHPGIVPVYELGQTPTGAPYYTMRLIRGERTLDDAIRDAHGLEERLALLEPFLKVCDAVRYAHSRGVIHRDLKPANIALGQFGEVVVLDWGMAKMRDRPDLAGSRWQSRLDELRAETDLKTLTSALGTPGYMAPEAALGRTADVDARSDIYSLGAILHRILTGDFPFRFTSFVEYVAELLKGVKEIPDVPAGLARICLRALANRREDRYPDAGELAAAVRAWQNESAVDREVEVLEGEAQTALQAAEGMEGEALLRQLDRAMALGARIRDLRPDHAGAAALQERAHTLRSRAIAEGESRARRRLLRRVVVAGLVAATAATVLVAVLLDGKRREAELAHAREAEQRARAEDLADFMLYDLKQGLEPVGRLDLLRAVARKSVEYYDSVPAGDVTDEVRRARARALGNVGDVFLGMGELTDAEGRYRAQYDALAGILANEPDRREWLNEQASCVNRIGDVLQETGDLPGALRCYEESVAIRRRILARDPDDVARDGLARSLDRVGDVRMRMGDREAASAAYAESLGFRRRLAESDPRNADWQRGLAVALGKRGHVEMGHSVDAALATFEEVLAINRRLLEWEPDNTEWKYDLAGSLFRIAYMHEEKGELETALGRYREALSTYRSLVERDPANALWQRGLALGLDRLADVLGRRGQRDEALRHLRESQRIKQRLAERDPTNKRARHDVAASLIHLGDTAKAAGDLDGAMESFREALAMVRRAAEEDPLNTDWQEDVANAILRIGTVHAAKNELADAATMVGEALAIYRRLATADPEQGRWLRNVAIALQNAGDLAKQSGNLPAALRSYRECLELRRRLADGDPENGTFQVDLVAALNRVGDVLRGAGQPAAAAPLWEESAAVNRRLVEKSPGDAGRRRELAYSLYYAGVLQETLGRIAEALRSLREAAAMHRSAVEMVPDRYAEEHALWTAAYRNAVVAADAAGLRAPADRLELAYGLFDLGRHADAAAAFEGALANEAIRADLTLGHLYNAACAAARAEGAEAERWRPRAVEWLAEDLRRRRELLGRIEEELRGAPLPERSQQLLRAKETLAAHFEHARTGDPDLASLRALPEFSTLFAEDDR